MVSITTLSNHIKRMLDKDWDYIAGVSGDAGVGKSSLVCQIGPLVDKKYAFERNNIYQQSKLSSALYDYPEKSFLNVDEAINVLYRRDFAKGGQKQLLKDFDMIRDRNLCVFFLIPNFWDLDTKILNSGRIKLWIYIDERGLAMMFRPDKNPFNPDRWNRELNRKLFQDWDNANPKDSPNFVDYLEFKPMDAELYKQYKEVKAKKRREAAIENDEIPEEQIDPKLLVLYALHDAGIANYKIAKQLKMAKETVANRLEQRNKTIITTNSVPQASEQPPEVAL